ncbi:hypothetical protein SAMN05661096_00605 [Marivirga sericea]|uniref:SprB repeat-containing protein n=1 Tax=Marivirga sericea TaxID=1028 RepID=A0A1X7IH37_9BACT|nr:hypothetical protein [Marivirga sericea]SMG13605.1 hypothetical protein SAMN05661096_00605 [Marivirga sericea]
MLKTIKIFQLLLGFLCLLSFGCTYEVLPEDNACLEVPKLILVSTEDSNCGDDSGEIIVEVEGLEGTPFKFSIDGESENATGRFENLPASTYLITVETIEGCTNTLDVEIKNQSGLNISVEASNSDCGSNSGGIVIIPEGGEPPYSFSLNNTDFQSEASFENLAAGEYTIFARDASACNVSQDVEIEASVSLSSVEAIIQANCVTSSCHGGNVNPDFRQAANITGNAGRIKSRTGGKTMPPSSSGKSLTDQEIELIACWVDSGANQ